MSLLTILLFLMILIILSIAALLFIQIRQHGKYFKERGVPFLLKESFGLLSTFSGLSTIDKIEQEFYKSSKKTGKKFTGFSDSFTAPAYYITDMDLMRNIYVKDFEHFVDRRKLATTNSESILGRMLVSLDGPHWRSLRSKLSPTFTTGKIKRMFNIFETSSHRMCDYILKATSGGGDYDICDAYSKYAMDVIASCAFGIDSKSFESGIGVPSEFEQMGRLLQFRFKFSLVIKFILLTTSPRLAEFLGIQPVDKVPIDYFQRVIKDVMKRRRETGQKENDFLQLMMDAQEGLLKAEENSKETLEVMMGHNDGNNILETEGSGGKIRFDDDDIVANCVLFLLGGFDTLVSLLIFGAYQLAREQEVQQKLYEEVLEFMENNNGKLTYESVLEMNYLDMFINETLRYFSPASRTERRCTKDYTIPNTDVVIKKDQIVALAVYGLHHDPEIYENPEKFDPERFLPENKSKRHPYAFAPFGHGPRNCIGMRFALTEAKAVIAMLVYKFKMEPCSKTDIPMKFSKTSVLKPANGMWLNFTPRVQMSCNC